MELWQSWTVLVALSFLPPLLYALWMRSRERYAREPLGRVLGSFAWGATIGVSVALLLNMVFDLALVGPSAGFGLGSAFMLAVVIAPVVEECSKGLGLLGLRKSISELEDGLVYGAALGLGFAATENFLYGVVAFQSFGYDHATYVIGLRVFSSTLLHAGASAILGFGYALVKLRGLPAVAMLPYFLIAMGLHAAYNFLVQLRLTVGLFAAIAMVIIIFISLQSKVKQLDRLPHKASR